MAILLVGNTDKSVEKYREVLHKRGSYTKRYQRDLDSGLMLPQPDDYRIVKATFKTLPPATKQAAEDNTDDKPDEVRIAGVANENAVDRMDERLEPAGLDNENFKLNPVLLADHLYFTRAVIGKVENVTPEDDGVKFIAVLGFGLVADMTEAQRDIRSLVKQGLLQTVSVGFIPLKIKVPEFDKDGRLIEPAVILQWELLEISIVAVPANAGSTFEMKALAKRFAYLSDTSHVNPGKNIKVLTADQTASKNNSSTNPKNIPSQKTYNDDDEEEKRHMEELKELIAELLGLVKTQSETQAKHNADVLKLLKKGSGSDDDDDDDDPEKTLKKIKTSIKDIADSCKKNSDDIGSIAKVLNDKLLNT